MSVTAINPKPMTSEADKSSLQAHLRPRRTLNRLTLALTGVAAGGLGQTFFYQGSLWDGLLLYAIAAILFAYALANRTFPKSRPLVAPPPLLPSMVIRQGWRRNFGVWLILLGLGISFVALNFFGNDEARLQAWWLYLSSLMLLVSGGLLLTRGDSWRATARRLLPDRRVALGLVLVLGLALFMRLFQFYSQPFGIWYDEAEAGLQARQMLTQPGYRPIFYAPINVTGHLLILYALALQWLGDNIYSMRLVSVLFGLGGVLAAYLFGRELRNPRFGLLLAFLVAVARWDVNFSRIAMTGIDAIFFEFLSLYFLIRLVRANRPRDALWAGLSLGFGLMFYTAFRLFVLALIIFVLIAAWWWFKRLAAAWQQGGWRIQLVSLGLLLISIWLVIMPLVEFAADNPKAFAYRTQQISIFNRRDQANLGQALWDSTQKHLLMFNYQGDKNGRHNLPGEPMLDPVMGILAVLGFGLALARTRYPANTFFLILFPLALIGGIFSFDFEEPQSLRSIAVRRLRWRRWDWKRKTRLVRCPAWRYWDRWRRCCFLSFSSMRIPTLTARPTTLPPGTLFPPRKPSSAVKWSSWGRTNSTSCLPSWPTIRPPTSSPLTLPTRALFPCPTPCPSVYRPTVRSRCLSIRMIIGFLKRLNKYIPVPILRWLRAGPKRGMARRLFTWSACSRPILPPSRD